MSTCPEQDLHSAYFDKEVVSPWREKLDAHIDSCDSCKEKQEAYQRLRQVLHSGERTLSDLELAQSYARLRSRIEHEERTVSPARGSIFNRRTVPALAAAILAAVILPAGIYMNTARSAQTELASLTFPAPHTIPARSQPVIIPDEQIKKAVYSAFSGNTEQAPENLNLKNVNFSSQDICGPRFSTSASTLTIRLPSVSEMTFFIENVVAQLADTQNAALP